MLDITDVVIGDKVHYRPDYLTEDMWENGMVKEIPEHTDTAIRVVFSCGGDWENFRNYTSALTDLKYLRKGWVNE